MRVSAKLGDPDYIPASERLGVRVFLDGIEQAPQINGRAVVSADDCTGEVVFYEMVDGDRPYRPFKTAGNELAEFTARGSVRIERPGYVDFAQLTRY